MTGKSDLDWLDWLPLGGYTALAVAWFSPVLGGGRLLGPGDGLLESIPDFLVHRTLWEPLIGTGYPAAADPLTFTWYPPAAVLSAIPNSYNAFVIAAYVLAAWFTFLLVRTLTGSRFAGWISGLLYGFSGFLMAHTGHLSMIHTAVWIPAVLLGLERVRDGIDRRWFAFGCFAVGSLVLAGHPQIMLYGLMFCTLYAAARRLHWLRVAATFGCGIGLGAVLLIPLVEFSRLTVREHVTFDVFNSYHLPVGNLILLFFPYLFGGEEGSIFGERWSVDTERDVFLGVTTLLLACLAFAGGKRKRVASSSFFAATAALALLFALGGDTPAGTLLFHVPGFNQFRAQSRFLVIFQFSMAVLAGFGSRAVFSRGRELGGWAARVAGILLLGEFAVAWAISRVYATRLHNHAASLGFADVTFDLTGPTLGIPLMLSAAGAAVVIWAAVRGTRRISAVLLSITVIGELASFGLFATWKYYSPSRRELAAPPTAALVQASGGRFVATRGFLGTRYELPPNLSKLWGLPSLGTYGSLAIERYHKLLEMDSGGLLIGKWWVPENRALDVAGAAYVVAGAGDLGEMSRYQRLPVPNEVAGADLGVPEEGGAFRESVSLGLDGSRSFTTLELVSLLRDSIEVPQDTPVLEVRIRTTAGEEAAIPVRAGRDTAEGFAACPSLAPRMKHGGAAVISTMDAVRMGEHCKAQRYFAAWPIAVRGNVSGLELKWLLPGAGIQILKLALWNKATGDMRVFSGADFYPDRFQEVATHQLARVYRNKRAMPRAWLVSEVIPMPGDAVRAAIQTSRLPDGRVFDPARIALVEDGKVERNGVQDLTASVEVHDRGKSVVEIRTHSRWPAFLVVGDLHYPGWRATVNGNAVPVVQTNYVQRGVPVPAGVNTVRFVFHPGSLYLGLGISLASLLAMAILCYSRPDGLN